MHRSTEHIVYLNENIIQPTRKYDYLYGMTFYINFHGTSCYVLQTEFMEW